MIQICFLVLEMTLMAFFPVAISLFLSRVCLFKPLTLAFHVDTPVYMIKETSCDWNSTLLFNGEAMKDITCYCIVWCHIFMSVILLNQPFLSFWNQNPFGCGFLFSVYESSSIATALAQQRSPVAKVLDFWKQLCLSSYFVNGLHICNQNLLCWDYELEFPVEQN